MHFIHDDMSELLKRLRIIDEAHKKDTGCHEDDLSSWTDSRFHTNMVSDPLADTFSKFKDTVRKRY